MKLLKRIKRWLNRRRKLTEPDKAVLSFIGAGDQVSIGELDTLDSPKILERLSEMKQESDRWAIVVTLSKKRSADWWVAHIARVFGWPLTRKTVQDGRQCFCTWGAF